MSEHFKAREFRCRCGKCEYARTDPPMDEGFLARLEELRHVLGDKPMTILSGYRCPEHNRTCGGAKASQHMALPVRCADIVVEDTTPAQVADAAEPIFNALGRYSGWTHVDTRPGAKARWRGEA